jgi:hypothetical protein
MIAVVLSAALALSKTVPGSPAGAGLSTARLALIDGVVAEGIAHGDLPGAVVLVGRGNRVLFRKAYGDRAVLPSRDK